VEPHDLRLYYGGTFDPVHDGHIATACAARDALATRVHMMPAADPPHRPPPGANALQRSHMLDLAIVGHAGLVVDRRELARPGRSYTIDTLRELRRELGPDQPIALLLGADSFIGLASWHDWQQLADYAHFVVAARPGIALDGDLPAPLQEWARPRWADSPAQLRKSPAGMLFRLNQPLHPVSASQVRQLMAVHGAWRELVPAAVADYIGAEGLYAARTGVHSPL